MTDLATINFTTQNITYKNIFPKIWKFNTAVFTSPEIYYVGTHDPNFNYDQ